MKAAIVSIVSKHKMRVMDGEPEIHGEEIGFCRPNQNVRFIIEARPMPKNLSPLSTPSMVVNQPADNNKVSTPGTSAAEKRAKFRLEKHSIASQSQLIKNLVNQQNLKTDFDKTMLVLYGSQSGKAKEFAERFAKMAELTDMFVNCRSIADYKFEKLHMMKLVVVITSTYGHGEPPENAVQLYEWLNQSHPEDHLKDVQYAVLKLGSSGTGT